MNSDGEISLFDRTETLNLLHRRRRDLLEGYRQNLALIGPRHIGKTVILRRFLKEIDDRRIVRVYVDVSEGDLRAFCRRLAEGLLVDHVGSAAEGLGLQALEESLRGDLPLTIRAMQKVRTLLDSGETLAAYREAVALPQVFTRESGRFCVLALDEFQGLETFGLQEVFQELGMRIMTQKRCLYVLASSLIESAPRILSERLSLLFGNFEVIEVPPFSQEAAEGFISEALGAVKISRDLARFLFDLTGGRPLYLQFVCRDLADLAARHRQTEVFRPLLCEALFESLFRPLGRLAYYFKALIREAEAGKTPVVLPSLLARLARERMTVKELAKAFGLRQTHVIQRLSLFVEAGLLFKMSGGYRVTDKVFRIWLRHGLAPRIESTTLDDDGGEAAHRHVEKLLAEFRSCQEKDLASRVVELLYAFEEESCVMNGRRYSFPQVRDVICRKVPDGRRGLLDVIHAVTSAGDWILALKREGMEEQDVAAVLAERRKLDRRARRCVLVPLAGMDDTARLKALQERMWIWGVEELNTFLGLCDKPAVMR